MNDLEREINDHQQVIDRCERGLQECAAELHRLDLELALEHEATAKRILAQHRPSGYETTILSLALLREPLDADQTARLQLLAREYLLPNPPL